MEEIATWIQEELEPCKLKLNPCASKAFTLALPLIFILFLQVVDARAGPGFKLTKPKKVKNIDGKKKSKLKKLHKFKRQSRSTFCFVFCSYDERLYV